MKPSAVFIPPLPRLPCRHCDGGDRFIPNRSAMDLDYAQYQLTQSRKVTERIAARPSSLSKEAYRKLLVDAVFNNRTRILSFNSKPPTPTHNLSSDSTPNRPIKQKRYISKSPESELDAPDIVDDYFLNLLDWGSSNVLSIALGNSLYLWTSDSSWELLTVQDYIGPITSVSWAPDGQHIAVGLNNSHIQLWDSTNKKLLRTLSGVHISRVGSLSWNNQNILTTGGRDGKIVNNDVRIQSHILQTYRGHNKEVCGLKWSASGQRLASGGNDNLLHIWDISMASSTPAALNQNRWVHRFEDHNAPVKALAWCPFQKNLLASGGGHNDRCIMFWDTNTGACLDSIDTGSQVCSLLWNNKERELLSTQGKQLTLWKYPSMVQIAELTGHDSRVLFMAQSPDGCTVASAGGDERVMIWNVFGNPQVKTKRAPQASPGPFSSYNHTKIR